MRPPQIILLCFCHASCTIGNVISDIRSGPSGHLAGTSHELTKRSAFTWSTVQPRVSDPRLSGEEYNYGGSVGYGGELGNGKTLTGTFGGFQSESGTIGRNNDVGLWSGLDSAGRYGSSPGSSISLNQLLAAPVYFSSAYDLINPYEQTDHFDNRRATGRTFDDFYQNPDIFYNNRRAEEKNTNSPTAVQSSQYKK